MDANYSKIWEAYLEDRDSKLVNEAPIAGTESPQAAQAAAGIPAVPPPPAAQSTPAAQPTTGSGDTTVMPPEEASAGPVSMTTLDQAPQVLRALADVFDNPAILTMIKKSIKDAAEPVTGTGTPPAGLATAPPASLNPNP